MSVSIWIYEYKWVFEILAHVYEYVYECLSVSVWVYVQRVWRGKQVLNHSLERKSLFSPAKWREGDY